jgi:hypothetical protein
LDLAIGIAYFCCLAGPVRRYRVERQDLYPFFADESPAANIPHIVSDESDRTALFRVYQATRSAAHTVQRLKEHVEQAKRTPALRPWVTSGDYGFAVLVPSSEKVKPYSVAIDRAGVSKNVPILLGLGPTTETLSSELRKRKGAA